MKVEKTQLISESMNCVTFALLKSEKSKLVILNAAGHEASLVS